MAGLDDDDDRLERSVAGNRVAELAAAVRGARPERDDEPDEIEVQEPEPEADPDELREPAVGRQERRSERNSSRRTAREEAAAAEARAQAYKEALELVGRNGGAQPQAPQQQGNPLEHIDNRIRKNYRDTEALHAEWNAKQGKMSAQEEQALKDRAIDLDVEKTTLIADRREAQLAPRRDQDSRLRALEMQFPDVYLNPQARQYASGVWNQLIATGQQDSKELHDTVMARTREEFLKVRPRPDQADRQRASGIGAGARQGARSDAPVRLSMPPGSALDRMARAAYPNDEPAVARQKWANKNGKAFVAARQRDDR